MRGVIQLAGVAALFCSLSLIRAVHARRSAPRSRASRGWIAEWRTNLWYWLAVPTAFAAGVRVVSGGVLTVILAITCACTADAWTGYGPVLLLPAWGRAIAALVCADFAHYWTHRLMHTRVLWPLHAVHHSSVHLDWHSALRIHPLDRVGMQLGVMALLLGSGFPPGALLGAGALAALVGVLAHYDTDADFGIWSRLIATPQFHRWHHADEPEAHDCNFAGVFPVWDLLFGTFHVPEGRAPLRFGAQPPLAPGLHGHLVEPVVAAWRRLQRDRS